LGWPRKEGRKGGREKKTYSYVGRSIGGRTKGGIKEPRKGGRKET
jgi:hypothetical protein